MRIKNNPITLTNEGWKEILEHPKVSQELELEEPIEEYKNNLYGVKFNNESFPNKGELFIKHIDNYTEAPPMVLYRDEKSEKSEFVSY